MPAVAVTLGPCSDGDPTISSQEGADVLLNCSSIDFPLTIISGFSGNLVLPYLVSMFSLTVGNDSDITALSLPNLTTITSTDSYGIDIKSPSLKTLNLPSLKATPSGIFLDTPALSSWVGTTNLSQVPYIAILSHSIPALHFSSLQNISEIYINQSILSSSLALSGTTQNLNLTAIGYSDSSLTINLPTLGSVFLSGFQSLSLATFSIAYLFIAQNVELTSLSLPTLQSVGPKPSYTPNFIGGRQVPIPILSGSFLDSTDALLIYQNGNLQNLSFPELIQVNGSIQVIENGGFAKNPWVLQNHEAGFPALKLVDGSFVLSGNIKRYFSHSSFSFLLFSKAYS